MAAWTDKLYIPLAITVVGGTIAIIIGGHLTAPGRPLEVPVIPPAPVSVHADGGHGETPAGGTNSDNDKGSNNSSSKTSGPVTGEQSATSPKVSTDEKPPADPPVHKTRLAHKPPRKVEVGSPVAPVAASQDPARAQGASPAPGSGPQPPNEALQQLNEERQSYMQSLDLNPEDRDATLSYATSGLPRVISVAKQGHPDVACRSLRDWKRYTSTNCMFQDRGVLEAVELSLDALVGLCPAERITRQELHRCG